MNNPERLGLVLIAYKDDKTEAMIKAIVALSGMTVPIEEIEKNRAEDFANRQAIWDGCVAEGKCQND